MIAALVPMSYRLPVGPPRSEGVHLSRVLRSMAVETGHLDKKWVEDVSLVEVAQAGDAWWNSLGDESQLRISLGMAWEQFYLPCLGNVTPQPGELVLDGIYMTPDGESLDFVHTESVNALVVAIHEVKCTYKSINTCHPIESQWLWLEQIRGYCKAARALIAYLHVLFVCGDYTYPIRPKRLVWRLEFTQAELDFEWETIRLYVKERLMAEREDAGLEGGV